MSNYHLFSMFSNVAMFKMHSSEYLFHLLLWNLSLVYSRLCYIVSKIYALMAVKSNLSDKSKMVFSISLFLLSLIRRITFAKRLEKLLASMYSSYVVASWYIINSIPLAWFISLSRVFLSFRSDDGFILFVCLCKVKKLWYWIWDTICQEVNDNDLPLFHNLPSSFFLVCCCWFWTWDWTFHSCVYVYVRCKEDYDLICDRF